jgi:hypothetical protein
MRNFTEPRTWETFINLNPGMKRNADQLGRELLVATLADWAKRIKAGEVPPALPRPAGLERNFVVTEWDWGAKESFIHDVTSTDKRNPNLYPNGKVYGADRTGGGRLWALGLSPCASARKNSVRRYAAPFPCHSCDTATELPRGNDLERIGPMGRHAW